jgi:hypothetical protein
MGQKALGSIEQKMEFDELNTTSLFHVIDVDTSYNALLGRPWMHVNRVLPSTLHQCFKFMKEENG